MSSHEGALLQLLHAGRIPLPRHVDDEQDDKHRQEKGHAPRDDFVEGDVLGVSVSLGARLRGPHRGGQGGLALVLRPGELGLKRGLGGRPGQVKPLGGASATDAVVLCCVNHVYSLQLFGAGADDRVFPQSFKTFQPVHQGTDISAAFPYIPGKADVIEGYPRIQNLLTNKCELVGIQVEALQIWDALENTRSTKSFDLIARQVKPL